MNALLLLAFMAAGGPRSDAGGPAATEVPAQAVGVDFEQKLDADIPVDLTFRAEDGRPVKLSECMRGKPTVLVLVQYRCPQLCNLVLNGLLDAMKGTTINAGEHYQVVTVSFDPRETPPLAAEKKRAYLASYNRSQWDSEGWRFLTGDAENIQALAQSVGFRYTYDAAKDSYAHASGVVIVSPQGKVSKYLYGWGFNPRDLRLSLVEASAGHVGSVVDKVLLLCFHYEPATGKYALMTMALVRAGAVATTLALAVGLAWAFRRERRLPRPAPAS